ncbi:phosphatidylglycerol lysyltransferase domain-containing protein [Paenibacillus arenilitoris]|uniref:DUF2156 domain-containing protein n=1 Tax=Paenibacillus arenilitoris TaxID=2772299 RepID=A0A927CPB6_9BACL|nr:phosphatidylglycerol lysyltransferase domain-containing protein [Paenibacillus arenilitoris]MBD2870308.1 DUF2156 domain-containing protein [Paenibacillus arenilitoris]
MIDTTCEERLNRLLARCGYNSHAHLYYLGDKEWFWDSEHEALIAYRSVGTRRIVLGDPIGSPRAIERVIEQFVADCRNLRQVPVFYQSKASNLPLYHRLGLQSIKIGEEARINLTGFHTNGKQWLKLRNRLNKFERGGYAFEVLHPPYAEPFLNRLQAISDEWLQGRSEKSFSVGAFSPEYINRFPVAVLTGPDGTCEAFASIAGDHGPIAASSDAGAGAASRRITVDLMRYAKACPHGTMDVLFLSLFKWARENGFDVCSLGMAPFANADDSFIVRLLYNYANKLYNFKGLYDYKNKFSPEWEDVYVIYPPATLPVSALLLAFIIHTPVIGNQARLGADPMRLWNKSVRPRKKA